MLRPFSFEKTDTSDQGNRNWRIFDENSKTIVYGNRELLFTSPTGDPDISQAFFTLYGPIVYFMMEIVLYDGEGWVAGTTTINMPFGSVYTGISKTTAMVPLFQVYDTTATILSQAYIRLGNTLNFNTTYTAVLAPLITKKVYIQGWYYRN